MALTQFLVPLAAAVIAFAALWPISVIKRDASIVDIFWGPGFLLQMLVSLAVTGVAPGAIGIAVFALVALWSLRLGWTLGRRRLRERHEDPRYATLRSSWGSGFWWKSLFVVFLLQAVLQWLVAVGAIAALHASTGELNVLSIVGIALALSGLLLEAKADAELDAFKRQTKGQVLCISGLRAHIRHPNYLGEIVFWIGVAIIGVSAGAWLAVLSPILMIVFLTRVSGIPMLDERLRKTRSGYAAYCARVPALWPDLRRFFQQG